MRGAPACRPRSVQDPSTVSALRADPPSPTGREGKTWWCWLIINSPPVAAARDNRWSSGPAPDSARQRP
ncbi:hypothetical protein FJ941_17020 [Mesorhizobium sp. B2-3-13]|nr:hypothetical protein FJ432_20545 [Mesorhizobium sp. B2-6-5]TPL80744.1 hypothetical protein FJ941_17020 [Mesorhizobium sp. B2-3-13]TPM05940.1 hypothetical protein FJ960_12450 [Mesorhizobium sp. B2-3-11]